MAQNNLQIENLHAFLVRSYIQHMNESSSFINESLNTIRRQDSAYNRMINDTFRLLNAAREQITEQEGKRSTPKRGVVDEPGS